MGEIHERPKAPTRRRLDTDVYYKMAKAGILGDPRHVELIDGEIIYMAAAGAVARLRRADRCHRADRVSASGAFAIARDLQRER
ncbi:MAG TPA: hypothetical protein VIZ19_05360 [Roseiarcus sp.]